MSLDLRTEKSLPAAARPPRWLPAAIHERAVILAVLGSVLAVAVGTGWLLSQPHRLQVSVEFVGYTNVSWGQHCALVQVSNASPFVVVVARSPEVASDPPTLPVGYAPTGWGLLESGESAWVITEPLTSGSRWKMTVNCQRLEHDDLYTGAGDRGLHALQTRIASWLEGHRSPIRLPQPEPRPYAQFATDWIDP